MTITRSRSAPARWSAITGCWRRESTCGLAPRYARTLWGDVSDGSPASTQSYYGLIAVLGAYLGG